jgi:formylglycine-generating enzyme required for sulfatase activity/predicted Ser/Thr protein kinase
MELLKGTLLQGGKFKIEKTLGQGGFGITYLAEQTNLCRKVCIKEFFMKEYGERTTASIADNDASVFSGDSTVLFGVSGITSAAAEIMDRYKEKFLKEARTIARLDHPGIVRIHDVFEENGTAYYVMDFIEGENLNDLVKREGALPEEKALGYIRQIADALSFVHDHRIMHLDVKPANVLIRKADDKAILIDFGAAKQYDSSGTQTSTTPVGLSAGYAPIEMTKPGGVQTFSPETDVYSLGASLYYLVTGHNPPDASERIDMIMAQEMFSFPEAISAPTVTAIEQSMQTRKKRTQSVSEFLEILGANYVRERKAEEPFGESIKSLINSEMVNIPGGEFDMGRSSIGWLFNSNASPLESPKHLVKLYDFSIGKFTVTHKIWNLVMGVEQEQTGLDDIPKDNVSWNEIQTFITRLNEITGESYRLPTEAEWEYAARGGRLDTETFSGDDNIDIVGWYKDNSSLSIHPCGQKLSNGYGLFDMSGNVWEWCADGFQKYSKDFEINPFQKNDKLKVLRGGSCASEKWKCRVTCRASAPPETKKQRYGFRLAK